MKNLLIALLMLISATGAYSQKVYAWWDVGLKTSYGLTGLVNTNLFDDRNYEHHLSSGFGVGGKFGFYFGLFNGISVDFMLSQYNQKFDYNTITGQNFNHSLKWSNYDLSVLYRLQKDGIYIELGPMISFVNKVTNKDDGPTGINGEVTSSFLDKYYSGVFGIGGYLFNYETFTVMLGLRMGYGFNDIVNATGKEARFPSPSQDISKYKDVSTNPAFVQLVLEANLALGYYGRTSCSKRATLFSF